ncbi:MAG: CbiX/SirB N-terminal domain-containing protein [Salinirussus sp.]
MTSPETIVIAAHGSLEDGRAAAPAHAHAERLRAQGVADAVRVGFWKEEPALRSVVQSIETGAATVVPLLTSEGYFAREVFPTELELPRESAVTLRYTDPIGTHPSVATVIDDRVATHADHPESTTVILVGHGTERNPRSAAATRRHADRVQARGTYAAVHAAFLDDDPAVVDVLERVSTNEVVVVPVFIADGPHAAEDVPASFGHPGIGQTANISGHRVHYTGAVGTAPSLADVIIERAVEAGAVIDRDESGRGVQAAERRLCERLASDDMPSKWGQVRIREQPESFAVCHVNDSDQPIPTLDEMETLAALRARVRRDATGGYRPLTGEPTLPEGWILSGLDTRDVIRALEVVYPGAVFAWDRDRRGTLDPTSLSDTLSRQQGMYRNVASLEPAEREAAITAVCGSCVRDRRWGVREGNTPDSGAGIPCAEACPFFLAAAHGMAEYGPEAADSVAPTVHSAAFDDPENAVRVRYARALDAPASMPGGTR